MSDKPVVQVWVPKQVAVEVWLAAAGVEDPKSLMARFPGRYEGLYSEEQAKNAEKVRQLMQTCAQAQALGDLATYKCLSKGCGTTYQAFRKAQHVCPRCGHVNPSRSVGS
jgi:membrane protease subunit (stomatin/prohibitin family)